MSTHRLLFNINPIVTDTYIQGHQILSKYVSYMVGIAELTDFSKKLAIVPNDVAHRRGGQDALLIENLLPEDESWLLLEGFQSVVMYDHEIRLSKEESVTGEHVQVFSVTIEHLAERVDICR